MTADVHLGRAAATMPATHRALLTAAYGQRLERASTAHDRHRSAVDRAPHPIVAAVVELHAPDDDGDDCTSCTGPMAWWPCDTFLLVESSLP